MEHIGRRTRKGVITCLDCGHSWKGNSELSDNLLGWECPVCGVHLKVTTTRKRVFRQEKYLCAFMVKNKFQVLRFFHVTAFYKAGQKAQYSTNEVARRWIALDGRHVNIARLRPLNFGYYIWNFGSKLEIRPEKSWHNLSPDYIYSGQKLMMIAGIR